MNKERVRKLCTEFKPPVSNAVEIISNLAEENNQPVFLVGGMVRDLLLGRASLDLDIVIEGNALELAERLAATGLLKITSKSRFGTAKLKYKGLAIDLVTARREEYKKPGALPSVFPGKIKDDLFRRDFTVNAMAISLNAANHGELFDPFGGAADLNKKLIRIIHDKSFIDDSTRIFRAVRYEQRLDFKLEDNTLDSIRKNLEMIKTAGRDRIRRELLLFLAEEYPEKNLSRADELGVLKKVCPALCGDEWISRHFSKARMIVLSKPGLVYLCLLIYRFSRKELEEFLDSYNFTRRESEAMTQTLELKSLICTKHLPEMDRGSIYKTLRQFTSEAIYANLAAEDNADVRKAIELYLTRLSRIKSSLTGADLVNMGIPRGPEVGKYLKMILEGRLAGTIKSRKDEELLVRKLAGSIVP